MKYALNLAEDGRILSATYEKYASEGAAIVDYLPDGNLSDYLYQDGAFVHDPLPITEPEPPTPAQQRENAYNTQAVIAWGGEMLTVTEASQKWQYYAAEGNTAKTDALTALIAEAKASIREQYPDEEGGA